MKRRKLSKKARAKLAAKRAEAKQLRQNIRHDFEKPSDVAWGTSPANFGEVKRSSEEARHVVCAECGYSGGRHSGFCSR